MLLYSRKKIKCYCTLLKFWLLQPENAVFDQSQKCWWCAFVASRHHCVWPVTGVPRVLGIKVLLRSQPLQIWLFGNKAFTVYSLARTVNVDSTSFLQIMIIFILLYLFYPKFSLFTPPPTLEQLTICNPSVVSGNRFDISLWLYAVKIRRPHILFIISRWILFYMF